MSLDEKIGQLISVGINATFLNQDCDAFRRAATTDRRQSGRRHHSLSGPVYESVILVNRMQTARAPAIANLSGSRSRCGNAFRRYRQLSLEHGCGRNRQSGIRAAQGEITAREARALGVQQIFAPVVDVNNNAANPVINVRSYGEDPADVARFAAAFTEGAQNAGAIATAKHFPGHGDTAVDSHRGLPEINVSRDRLNTVEFVPFRSNSRTRASGAVMVGHIALPQIDADRCQTISQKIKAKPTDTDRSGEIIEEKATMPATMSPVIGNILRKDLKFQRIDRDRCAEYEWSDDLFHAGRSCSTGVGSRRRYAA